MACIESIKLHVSANSGHHQLCLIKLRDCVCVCLCVYIYNVRNCISLVRSQRLLRIGLVCPNQMSRVGGGRAARDCAAQPLPSLEIRLRHTGPQMLRSHHLYAVARIIYTGCPRKKGPNFGRVFLRSNYTNITQNTYIQSSMVTEILAREV